MAEDDPIETARRQGERAGADRYLPEIVAGRIAAKTGRPVEDVRSLMPHLTASSFTDDQGEVDDAKITAFAGSIAPTPQSGGPSGAAPFDPVAAALGRQRPAGGGDGGVAQKREDTYNSMTKPRERNR